MAAGLLGPAELGVGTLPGGVGGGLPAGVGPFDAAVPGAAALGAAVPGAAALGGAEAPEEGAATVRA